MHTYIHIYIYMNLTSKLLHYWDGWPHLLWREVGLNEIQLANDSQWEWVYNGFTHNRHAIFRYMSFLRMDLQRERDAQHSLRFFFFSSEADFTGFLCLLKRIIIRAHRVRMRQSSPRKLRTNDNQFLSLPPVTSAVSWVISERTKPPSEKDGKTKRVSFLGSCWMIRYK